MLSPAKAIAAGAVVFALVGAFPVAQPLDQQGSMPGAATDDPAPDLGIFAPVAGQIVYGDDQGIWGVDPATPADLATAVLLTSEPGVPLGWSSDGTRLLVMRGSSGEGQLYVLHADGSESIVTERPMTIRGATISPDGSRVVFAGRTEEAPRGSGSCCSRGFGLYVVEAVGGPAEQLVESRYGILDELTISPDGTQIAYVDGRGDWGHSVWLVDIDGTDAHQILANETTEEAGHPHGLAWSPAGDRIALGLEGTTYTFATDGSGFTRVIAHGDRPYWAPDGSRFAYTTSCIQDPDGCGLAIADADGSNAREISLGTSGPWHPTSGRS